MTRTHPHDTDRLRRNRQATIVQFLLCGAVLGMWASRLPAVKHGLGLTDGDLGLVLLVGGAGVVTSQRLAGPLMERLGSRAVARVGAVGGLALLAPVALAVDQLTLTLTVLALMLCVGLQTVGINAQAVAIEARYGRPLLSSFHAAFSIGGIAGASAGGLLATLGVSHRASYAGLAVVGTAVALLANRALLDARDARPRAARTSREHRRLPHRGLLWLLGAVALASFVSEGAAADWSAVYLHDEAGATSGVAALGYAVFATTMTVGRLLGDRAAQRFGAFALIRVGTAAGAAFLAVGLLPGTVWGGLLAFGGAGLALSVVIPQVFSTAGRLAGDRAPAALAVVSMIAFSGLLIGPSAIGALAAAAGLPRALWLPVALLTAASLLAWRLQRRVAAAIADVTPSPAHASTPEAEVTGPGTPVPAPAG